MTTPTKADALAALETMHRNCQRYPGTFGEAWLSECEETLHAYIDAQSNAEVGTAEQELLDVINKRFDYLVLRTALSELSGVPCMAITTDEHIKAIQAKLSYLEGRVRMHESRLSRIVNAIKGAEGEENE